VHSEALVQASGVGPGWKNLSMRRLGTGLFVGIAVGVAVTSLFVLLRPSRTWQEESIRAQAESLGCGLPAGISSLNAECVRFSKLAKTGNDVWTVMYESNNLHQNRCYDLRPFGVPPSRRSCPRAFFKIIHPEPHFP
jgi:hypothetical protein